MTTVWINSKGELKESDKPIPMGQFYRAHYVSENGTVVKDRYGPINVPDTKERRENVPSRLEEWGRSQ